MASVKKYELIASVGTYKDASGKTVKRWERVGVVFESPGGKLSARLDVLPLRDWSGFLSFKPVLPPGRKVPPGFPDAPDLPEAAADEHEDDAPPF